MFGPEFVGAAEHAVRLGRSLDAREEKSRGPEQRRRRPIVAHPDARELLERGCAFALAHELDRAQERGRVERGIVGDDEIAARLGRRGLREDARRARRIALGEARARASTM